MNSATASAFWEENSESMSYVTSANETASPGRPAATSTEDDADWSFLTSGISKEHPNEEVSNPMADVHEPSTENEMNTPVNAFTTQQHLPESASTTESPESPESRDIKLQANPVYDTIFREKASPNAHFLSLENILNLYSEIKTDRDELLKQNKGLYKRRFSVSEELRELDKAISGLLLKKMELENDLEVVGGTLEENREKMICIDEKVINIAEESRRFETIVRNLKKGQGFDESDGDEDKENETSENARFLESMGSPGKRKKLLEHKKSEACERTLYGHTGHVLGIDVNEGSSVIISASSDQTIRTWDLDSGRRIDTLYGHSGWVHAVAFSKSGHRAVSGSGDHSIKIWDLGHAKGIGSCISTIEGHDAGVTAVQLDENGVLVSGSLDRTLRRYDLSEGSSTEGIEGTVIQGHESGVHCLQFWRHGLASGGGDSLVKMHDLRTGLCHRTLVGHTNGAVRALQFDERKLISGGTDCALRFWDLRTGNCTTSIETDARINDLQFDESRLYVACADRLIKVYDLQSMKLIEEHGGHLGSILTLARATNTFCTGSSDHTLKMWTL